ncbi:MAG TPA: tetratricopeptide repeat protein [Candidatus Polarisedimenticolaceae bacterium]
MTHSAGTSWKERGHDALRRGDFEEALDAYRMARDAAIEADDDDAADRIDLNIATTRLQMGDARGAEEGLRALLLRASDTRVAFTAAYNLASSLRRQGRLDRALSYARRAEERAAELDDVDAVAPVHTLLGNVLLQQGRLDEARRQYETSLALRLAQPGDVRFQRAILEENLGYCLLLQGEHAEGITRIATALEIAGDVGDRRCAAECLQDLCYAHLMIGDYPEAGAWGARALDAAREGNYRDLEENCHYLLGELGSRTGDVELRDRHFEALQSLHPEVPLLREFLTAVDVTGIITLKR